MSTWEKTTEVPFSIRDDGIICIVLEEKMDQTKLRKTLANMLRVVDRRDWVPDHRRWMSSHQWKKKGRID